MSNRGTLEDILDRLRATQLELEQEIDRLLAAKRQEFQYSLQRGKVVFERSMHRFQRQQRTGLWRYLRHAPLAYLLSAPLIYSMIVPLLILDLSITLYQHVCFRVYRIPRVRRADYLVIDRHHLAYLNAIEKFNCVYCGYSNGLMSYAREITARTEQFWCPVKHAQRSLDSHLRTGRFLDYGDAEAWRRQHGILRRQWEEKTPFD